MMLHTWRMLSALLMSPEERATTLSIPSSVTCTLGTHNKHLSNSDHTHEKKCALHSKRASFSTPSTSTPTPHCHPPFLFNDVFESGHHLLGGEWAKAEPGAA